MYGIIYGDVLARQTSRQHKPELPTYGMATAMALSTAILIQHGFKKDPIRLYQKLITLQASDLSESPRPKILSWAYGNPTLIKELDESIFTRCLPLAYVVKSERTLLKRVQSMIIISHANPSAIMYAQMISLGVYLALHKQSKKTIEMRMTRRYGFTLTTHYAIKQEHYVNIALQAFLKGKNFDNVLQQALNLSNRQPTIVAMAGALAEAYYGISNDIVRHYVVPSLLVDFVRLIRKFYAQQKPTLRALKKEVSELEDKVIQASIEMGTDSYEWEEKIIGLDDDYVIVDGFDVE